MIDLMQLVTEARDDQPRAPGATGEGGATDYGAGAPVPDEDPTDAAEAAPDNTPGVRQQGVGGSGQQPAGPQGPQPAGPGGPAPAQGQPGPGEEEGMPPEGAEGDPNAMGEEGGGEGEDPYNADPNSLDNGEDSVNRQMGGEQPEDEMRRAGTTIVALLRSYISLYNLINRTIRKLGESRKNSVLASVTYNQVKSNLYTLADMIFKYIILEFDGTPHEINVYNFNYMLEIFNWNVEMLETVDRIQKKAMEKSDKLKKA